MSRDVKLHLAPGSIRQADGLCPQCALTSMVECPIFGLFTDGPRQIGIVRRCTDCA